MESTEEALKSDWREDLLENWCNTRLAHEAMMLGRTQRQQFREEALVDHVRGLAGMAPLPQEEEGEEMGGVEIGRKQIETHYHTRSNANWLQYAAMVAALLGAGYIANDYWNVGPDVVDTDTDHVNVFDFP